MKTAEELGITEQQRTNLAKLAVGIRKLKPNGYKGEFMMNHLCGEIEGNVNFEPYESVDAFRECGTCGCLLGHAPFLGIEALHSEDWDDYSERVFGYCWLNITWLFCSLWPNDKEFAAKRIAWVLKMGWPERNQYFLEVNNYMVIDGFDQFQPDWEAFEKLANS
jgi:hypothetical protein